MATFGTVRQPPHNPNKDWEVQNVPNDTVSSLSFNPQVDYLLSTSWDGDVRCWEILPNGTSNPKYISNNAKPVLCSAWKEDGHTAFFGGCDNQAKMWPVIAGTPAVQVAQHDAPIRELAWIKEMNLLVTASWDKTLRYWDTRQANPAHVQQLPGKAYAMSVTHPLLTVATSDRKVLVFNLQNPQTVFKTMESPLKYQTRAIANYPDKTGFLISSIEGRVGIHHIDDSLISKNFSFKCHREGAEAFPVNVLRFHPIHGTFVTAGGDGSYGFWDKDSRQRLKHYSRANLPITTAAYNKDGKILAYALGYDWGKGAAGHNPNTAKYHIMLRPCQDGDTKPKPKSTTGTRR